MTLPEIPDEALDAAEASADAFTHEGHPDDSDDGNCYRCIYAAGNALQAAWPHLYAAALRHAAALLLADDPVPDKQDWSARETAGVLEIWADWATS